MYTKFAMMRYCYFFIIITLKLCTAQDSSLENEYVQNITRFNVESENWIFPINSYSYLNQNETYSSVKFHGYFDFIIVGAGSAGCVIANRLSEITEWKILLIEAGDWENNITDIPGEMSIIAASNYNWGYNVTNQKNGFGGYINNSINAERGKGIGGTSIVNAMMYGRGNKDDYNKWASLGNPGWSYQEVLPYFKKSEHANFTNASTVYHGTRGNINVQYSPAFDDRGQAFLDAYKELGRKNVDYNANDQIGASIFQLTEINGRRNSAGKGFINPIRNRTNLIILRNTLATKILINKRTKSAFGVAYLRNGKQHIAKVTKEVILSAGALNTPQLLMISGIGPRDHLEEFNIDVIKDLPVGLNLWDHLFYNIQSFTINYIYPEIPLRTQVEEYLNGTGPLSTATNFQCAAFVDTLQNNSTVPDIMQAFTAGRTSAVLAKRLQATNRYTDETINSVIDLTQNQSLISLQTFLLHPKSRGYVKLKSKSPLEYPIINPNYLNDPEDLETLLRGVKDQLKIMNTSAIQTYNATLVKQVHPLCNNTEYGSDDFWKCMIREMGSANNHYSGTCTMGPKNNKNTVVDANLKVHGIKNLRVADCSVIPVTISGPTNAPALMIGEKAGDIIKQYYNKL